ncbi:MAG TPA: hypothetical protein VK081_03070 [Planctomycetota bacterium]|nr:hypothetical protein [Planctomycetota bacterium]
MERFKRALLALVFGMMTGAVVAQAQILVPDQLTAGAWIDVTYSDASKAGQTVKIRINSDAFPVPDEIELEILLDSSGSGTVRWQVPGWGWAAFNAPDAPEEVRFIGVLRRDIATVRSFRNTKSSEALAEELESTRPQNIRLTR